MNDWDDQDIETGKSEFTYGPHASIPVDSEEPRSFLAWPLIVAGLLALMVGVGIFWLFSTGGPITVPEKTVDEAVAAPPEKVHLEESPTSSEEEVSLDLPKLSESDLFVRDLLRELSTHAGVLSFLVTDSLVRKIVAVVINIAEGENPARHFLHLMPEKSFSIIRKPMSVSIDPDSYKRYDVLTSGFTSISTEGLVSIYRDSKPLIDEAFAELGYENREFEESLARAISILLKTPVVEQNVGLYADSVNYTFVDQKLETLSFSQKLLFRMGPANTRKVQQKIRLFAEALNLRVEN